MSRKERRAHMSQVRRTERRAYKVRPEHRAEVQEAMEAQRRAFVAKFGREPGPSDPIFFDPDAASPQPMSEEAVMRGMLQATKDAGMNPAFVYAAEKTGRIVTQENKHNLTAEEIREWNDAVAEYERQS